MAFRILGDETVEGAVKRIAVEQIDKALDHINDGDMDIHQRVHKVRTRCKKVRGVIRLVRPQFESTYSAENARFRDAARKLSGIRDAASMIECFDALMVRYDNEIDQQQFASIRQELVKQRMQVSSNQSIEARLDALAAMLKSAKIRVKSWSLDTSTGFDAVAGGLKITYKRAQDAMDKAIEQPTTDTLHEWRKRVKYNRYHTRTLTPIWPRLMQPMHDEVTRLSDLLGDEHDLAVLHDTLTGDCASVGSAKDKQALLDLINDRRQELQAWASAMGRRLYGEKPKRYIDRHRLYWKAWQAERQLEPVYGKKAVTRDS